MKFFQYNCYIQAWIIGMLINSFILEQKINQYFTHEITRQELGYWSKQAYYALMKGEYIEIEKLFIYHFLRTISTFHIVPNDITDEYPCSEEDVINIKEVLCGNKNINYTFRIKIHKNIYSIGRYKSKLSALKKMKSIIDEILAGDLPPSAFSDLIEYSRYTNSDIETLIDLLESNIKGIIAENIAYIENTTDFKPYVDIYVGGRETDRENIFLELNKLLNCAMGNISFRITVIYQNGTPRLSLLLI